MPKKLASISVKKLDESLLTGLTPFQKLTRAQIREILDLSLSKLHPAGTAIFTEGMPADRFHLLLDGHVRVLHTTANGDQVIALHIAGGQLFGIAAALGHETYPATAIAADDCLVLSWPNRLWPEFAAQYPGFSVETYKIAGKRMVEMNDRVIELATQQVEQRIACVLLRLISQTGKKAGTGVEIDFPITRQNLSEMTGTTLHTVSRLLSAWEKEGIIESGRRRIVVTQPDRVLQLSRPEA